MYQFTTTRRAVIESLIESDIEGLPQEKVVAATTLVYNIPGDRWQMAYEVLEALIANLKIETPKELCDE